MGLRSQVTCLSREVPKHENNLEGSVLRAIAIAALSQLKYIVIEKKRTVIAWKPSVRASIHLAVTPQLREEACRMQEAL